jgi:hypothetical protein
MAAFREKPHISLDEAATSSGELTASNSKYPEDSSQVRRSDSEEGETASLSTAWTESTDVPKRHMGLTAVVSLMINQMIGTGVFETPGYVLFLTGSKQISLVLWGVGGIYQIMR